MQPIRQWLTENINEEQDNNERNSDLLENYEQVLSEKKQWRKPFAK